MKKQKDTKHQHLENEKYFNVKPYHTPSHQKRKKRIGKETDKNDPNIEVNCKVCIESNKESDPKIRLDKLSFSLNAAQPKLNATQSTSNVKLRL